VYDHDLLIGQFCAWIQCCQLWIVPFLDLAEKNSGDRVCVELECRIFRQIIGYYHGACDCGNVKNLPRCFAEVVIAHRTIGCTEIDCLREDLLLASA
jgi:hypothetical protein